MTQRELAERQERATREVFVISRTEEGYRIYAPTEPRRVYLVNESEEGFHCSCPDFAHHAGDPEWQCKHVLAIRNQSGREAETSSDGDRHEREERRAIQEEARAPRRRRNTAAPNGTTQMCVKRSVSPDGRIDSLSVEFSCPVETVSDQEAKARAKTILAAQSEIIEEFLTCRRQNSDQPAETPDKVSPAVPARMLRIEGMDGKWGRRLYIAVAANGQTLRLFGSVKQLAEHITEAGFPDVAQHIAEGTELNLPCRVTTKPSPDGRFVNVDRVLAGGTQSSPRLVRR